MAPKKKSGKKAADDWEDELGETPDPIAQATLDAKAADAAADAHADEAESGGGGLLAALRKNKDKRKKKGKVVDDEVDFVQGEDPPAAEVVLEDKAPEEANLEDEDLFANAGGKKGKGGKKDVKATAAVAGAGDDDEDGEGGMKSKKEKEKEKREREKARKKEQVCGKDR